MQFIDLYLPPNSPVTSFPVVIGAASLNSDGGTTSFWCWQGTRGKKRRAMLSMDKEVRQARLPCERGQVTMAAIRRMAGRVVKPALGRGGALGGTRSAAAAYASYTVMSNKGGSMIERS